MVYAPLALTCRDVVAKEVGKGGCVEAKANSCYLLSWKGIGGRKVEVWVDVIVVIAAGGGAKRRKLPSNTQNSARVSLVTLNAITAEGEKMSCQDMG